MNMKQAQAEMIDLFGMDYYSLKIEITMANGKAQQECVVYASGLNHCHAPTWREAIDKLKAELSISIDKAKLFETEEDLTLITDGEAA